MSNPLKSEPEPPAWTLPAHMGLDQLPPCFLLSAELRAKIMETAFGPLPSDWRRGNYLEPSPRSIWPKEDEIRWVEQRFRERERIRRDPSSATWFKSGTLEEYKYKTWLLHVTGEELSFQEIGDQLFPEDRDNRDDVNQDPAVRKRKAYLAFLDVEWELGRGRKKKERKQFSEADLTLVRAAVFGAIPI